MDKALLQKHITMLDFMATDLQLFLDTHPEDMEALEMYNKVVSNADKCRCYYENTFGPICSFRSLGRHSWDWDAEPWPWQRK